MAMAKQEEQQEAADSSAANPVALPAAVSLKKEEDESQKDSVVPSSLAQWLSESGTVTPENFKEIILHVTDVLLQQHGGPYQYLVKVLGAEPGPLWKEFAGQLSQQFTQRPDLVYLDTTALSSDNDKEYNLSLWQLGWSKDCSSKPPTFKTVARRLIDEFICHSFVSQNDPLLLYQGPSQAPSEDDLGLPLFFTHYVKGAARATSVLFLAHVLVVHLRLDLASLHPALHQSLVCIKAKELLQLLMPRPSR